MVGGPHDDIQAELDRMGAGQGVDRELERMKLEISQNAPRQLEGAEPGSSDGASAASEATVVDPAEAGEPE
jgi:hypothetical protein